MQTKQLTALEKFQNTIEKNLKQNRPTILFREALDNGRDFGIISFFEPELSDFSRRDVPRS